jgi:hypothetical protein
VSRIGASRGERAAASELKSLQLQFFIMKPMAPTSKVFSRNKPVSNRVYEWATICDGRVRCSSFTEIIIVPRKLLFGLCFWRLSSLLAPCDLGKQTPSIKPS